MEGGEIQEVEVKKIGVFSIAKHSALLGILTGLVLGIISTFVFFRFPQISNYMGTYSWIGTYQLVLFPLTFGLLFFVKGMVTALFYNLSARMLGGIKLYS